MKREETHLAKFQKAVLENDLDKVRTILLDDELGVIHLNKNSIKNLLDKLIVNVGKNLSHTQLILGYALVSREEYLDFPPCFLFKICDFDKFIPGSQKYADKLNQLEENLNPQQQKLYNLLKSYCVSRNYFMGMKNIAEFENYLNNQTNITNAALETLNSLLRTENSKLSIMELTEATKAIK